MSEPLQLAALASQVMLAAVGALLFWRLYASPAARAGRPPSPLPAWDLRAPEILQFVLYVFAGGFFGSLFPSLIAKPLEITGDKFVIFSSAGSQLGMLGGVALFALTYPDRFKPNAARPTRLFLGGFATYAIAMPFVFGIGYLWLVLLEAVGLPMEKQTAVEIFIRTKSAPWLLVFAATAVLVAPAAEELIFRAGLFRYLRTRVPRWAALLLPGCFFAAMHLNLSSFAQLVVLGVAFALAYERTGHIATAIIAHALFNLNNVLLLLAGVDK